MTMTLLHIAVQSCFPCCGAEPHSFWNVHNRIFIVIVTFKFQSSNFLACRSMPKHPAKSGDNTLKNRHNSIYVLGARNPVAAAQYRHFFFISTHQIGTNWQHFVISTCKFAHKIIFGQLTCAFKITSSWRQVFEIRQICYWNWQFLFVDWFASCFHWYC